MNNKIEAISFDFWNTLFRDHPSAAYRESRLRFFLETVRPYRECYAQQVEAAFIHSSQVCQRIWSEEYRTPVARERLELVLAHLALELPNETLDDLARYSGEVLYEHPPTLIKGAAEVLAALAPYYKLAIISDTGFAPGRVLRELMRRNGIYEHFDVFTFSDEAGRSKPHQSVFLQTAEALGVSPEKMLHIGDLEPTDVAGAKAVGATAVLFAADAVDTLTSAADFIIKSHSELLSLLEQFGK